MTQRPGDAIVDAGALTGSARWHVHQVLPTGRAEMVAMTRAAYAASDFLDHRIAVPEGAQVATIDFAQLPPLFPDVSQLRTAYIFHISHVGSTFLAKALATRPSVLCLREPQLLRWMAEIRRDLGEPESRFSPAGYAMLLRGVAGLLGRGFAAEDQVVVKATSFAANLAGDLLHLMPLARATALYSYFEPFAANILRGKGGWMDMLTQAPSRLRRLHRVLDRCPWRLADLSHGELIAMNWLCEMVQLIQATRAHPGRICWMEFDDLVNAGPHAIGEAARFLGLGWTGVDTERLTADKVLTRYSKDGRRPFDRDARKAELAAVIARCGDELARGRAWLDRAISDHEELAVAAPFVERIVHAQL